MLVLLVSNGLTATALSVYDEKILQEFGWSRGQLKFRDLISFWLIALLAPMGGALIDRLGPRRMITIGFTLLSVGYVLYSRLDSLGMLYAIHVVLALGLLFASTMTCVILISNWFYTQRGMALGIALVGTSLGGIVLSPLNAALIEHFGWRRTFLMEAALPIVMMVVVLLVVRNSPRDVGATAVGVDASARRDLRLEGLTLQEALRTRTFWAIGLSGMLTYYSILALYSHLFLHMRGLGYAPVNAGAAISLLALLALTGKRARRPNGPADGVHRQPAGDADRTGRTHHAEQEPRTAVDRRDRPRLGRRLHALQRAVGDQFRAQVGGADQRHDQHAGITGRRPRHLAHRRDLRPLRQLSGRIQHHAGVRAGRDAARHPDPQ
jgi:MFS family permease